MVGCLSLFVKWQSRTKEGQIPKIGVRMCHFSPSHCSGKIVACTLLPCVARKRHRPSANLVPAHSSGVRMRHHWSRYRSTQVIVPSSMGQGVATERSIPGKNNVWERGSRRFTEKQYYCLGEVKGQCLLSESSTRGSLTSLAKVVGGFKNI